MTTLAAADVRDTSSKLDVLMTANTLVSITYIHKLANALTVSTTSVAVDTTPRVYSFAAPLNFQSIMLSPTTAFTSQSPSATVIQSK